MGYVNIKIREEKGLHPIEPYLLQLVHQNRTDDISEEIMFLIEDGNIQRLYSFGLIEQIKGTKKMDEFQKLRLTKKGKKWLEDLQTPDITEGDIKMFNYLCDMYLNSEDTDREIGNKKLTKMYCAQFRQILSLSLKEMYWLCYLFIKEYEYTKKLENIFFVKDKNRYGKFKDNIDSSKLFQFFEDNKERIEKFWKERIK